MKRPSSYFQGWLTHLIFGSLAWLGLALAALLGVVETGLVEQLLLLAPTVIIPLGLALVEIPPQAQKQQWLYRWLKRVQPIGAALAILAFLVPGGLLAGALAVGWLGVTGLIALLGLLRFVSNGYRDPLEIGLAAGLGYVAVGGGWLVISRLGFNPMEFGPLIVLLTAVHFHYAGFAAPIMASIAGRHLAFTSKKLQMLHRVSLFGVIAGMPIVAAGITFSPLLELIGAIELAASMVILAGLMLYLAVRGSSSRSERILLTVSAVCLIIGMSFTGLYAVSEFSGNYLVIIPQMIRFHGIVNALGFALCGLLAWNIARPRPL
jgi:hypothetical protein